MKEKADELMAFEEEEWNNERQVDMLRKETQFKTKLSAEAEALKKKVAQGRADQNRLRQLELERLLQRYHNVKSDLEGQHKLERQKMEREMIVDKAATQNSRRR
jgi:membrane protein involved in colicin uptake